MRHDHTWFSGSACWQPRRQVGGHADFVDVHEQRGLGVGTPHSLSALSFISTAARLSLQHLSVIRARKSELF